MKQVFFGEATSGSPDSTAWHAWRKAGIGASDAAVIAYNAGLLAPGDAAPWQKDYDGLLEEKRGEAKKADRPNFAAARGRALEATVAEMVKSVTGIPFAAAFGEMDEAPIVRSSFDGVTFDLECISEIKVANVKVHEAAKVGDVIPYYRPQLAHQALTAWGPPEGWGRHRSMFFTNYREADEGCPLATVEIPSHTAWLIELAAGLLPCHLAFWKEVEQGRQGLPPEVLADIEAFKALRAEADRIDREIKALRTPILRYVEGLGVPKFEDAGISAVKQTRNGSVDLEKACAGLGIDPSALEAFREKPSASWILKVVR